MESGRVEPALDGEVRRRCVLSRATLEAPGLQIDDPETINYLSRAIRLRSGDRIECFDGQGAAREAQLQKVSNRQICGQWLEQIRTIHRPRACYPLPVLALLKGKDNDEAIRVHSELGLPKLRFFYAERDARGKASLPLDRWRRVVQEACRQSGGYHLLQIEIRSDLAEAIEDLRDHQFYFGDAHGERPNPLDQQTAVVIGPEGGFSSNELDQLHRVGARGLRLGWGTLRARSASVVLPAALSLGAS